jgi:PAS domain S-box-containing protein
MSERGEAIRVLHVDDDPGLVDVAATFLEREDDRITVRSATSAADGLAVLETHEVDCVVSDYEMPGQNGIDFLEAVRETYPDLPFILYTGKGSEEVASEAVSAGVTDYMQKETGTDQYAVLANRVANSVEQYRAEQEAERTRRRLEELSESTTDCLWMFDRDWEELLFISGYEEVWERPESAIREDPKDFLNGVHPDDREFVSAAMDRLSDGESIDIEYRILRGGGEQGAVWVKGEPVFEDGDVVRVVGFTRDITERREQSRRLETLISNLPGIAYRARNEPGWPMEVVRGECEELTGYTAEAVESGAVSWGGDVLHPDDRERIWDTVQGFLEEDRPFEVTYRIRTEEGETKWMWERGRLVDAELEDEPVLEGFITDITERRRREQELRRYEAYLEESTDIITVLDDDGTIKYQSPAVTRLLGYGQEELVGENGFDFIHPDDVEELLAHFEDLLSDPGATTTVECRFRTADGDWVWLEVHGKNQLGNEAIEGVVTNNRVITERKEREQDLERTNALLSTLVETLPVGVLAEDGSRNVLAVNERLLELFGIAGSPAETVGADCERLAREVSDVFADPEEFVARIDRLVDTRESVRGEELHLRDGRTFARSHEPIELPEGEGHLWVYREITERRDRERRLRETTSRLEALFEQSPDMINVHDTEGNIIDPNPRLVEKTGYDREELAGMKVWELDQTLDRDAARDFWAGMDHGDRERLEGVYRRRDGSTFPVEVHIRRLELNGDDRFIAISRETTERKERERELSRQNERLEEFASVVSHDLRNPLNVAQGRLELLAEECDSEHAEPAREALERMGRIIEDVLWLAREGKDIGTTGTVDLREAVGSAWEMAAADGAELVVDLTGSPAVDADGDRLGQLLENLFRNSVEHAGEDVTVTAGESEGGFYVEDDGPGIPEAEREDVFDAGYTTSQEGTGFGLSIVERIAEAHGWEVEVTESPVGGARFEVTGVEFVDE